MKVRNFNMLINLVRTLTLLLLVVGITYGQSSVQGGGENQLFSKGLELFQKGSYREARSTFDTFVEQYPESSNAADAEYYKASSALKMYHLDGEQLMTSFMSDYAWHPKAEYANYEMGLYYYQDRVYDKSIKYLSRAVKSGLGRAKKQEVNFKLGYSHFARKKFNKAQPSFDVLKRMANPYFDASNYYAAYIEIENKQFAKAIVDLKKIENSEGYSRAVPYMLAGVYYEQERFQDVIDYLEGKLESPISEKKNVIMLLADSYFRINQFEKASKAFDEYMSVGKGKPSADVLFRMGYSYYKTEQDEKAIDSFKKMASKETEVGVQASFYLAALYLKKNNYQYAIPALDLSRKYLEEPELKKEAQFLFAKANYAAGKHTDAIIAFQAFLKEYPTSSHYDDANDLLSEVFLNSSDYERAIEHIEAQPRLSSNMQMAYQQAAFHRGAELYNMNKFKDAVEYFDKSIKYPLDNDFLIKAYYWKAEAFSRGNRYEEAIYPYQKVLFNNKARETPYYLKSKYGLGYSYYNTKDYNSALTQFRDYANLAGFKSGRYSDVLIRLADCYYVTKSYSEAVSNYDAALKLKGGEKDYAHLQLGIIQGILTKDEQAFSHFDVILNNYPKSRFVDDALFEKGNLQFERGMYDLSVRTYNALITQKNASRYLPYGLIRSAISYFNL